MSYRQERSLQSVNLRHWWSINTNVGRFYARGAFYFWFIDTNIDKREVFCVLTANFRCIAWWSTEIPSSQTLSRSPSFACFLLPIGFLCCNTRIFSEVALLYRVTWLQVCVCDWGISGFSLCQLLLVIWDICPLLSWWLRPGLAYSFGHTK